MVFPNFSGGGNSLIFDRLASAKPAGPAPTRPGKFIFIGDEWHPQNLSDSRLVWLPLTAQTNGLFKLRWYDRWNLSVFDSKD